jgi:hypothetical protein
MNGGRAGRGGTSAPRRVRRAPLKRAGAYCDDWSVPAAGFSPMLYMMNA